MSSYPQPTGQPNPYTYQPPPTNGLAVAGFVVSLTGIVVCMGVICPIGLILSLIALTKAPRGFAIAGTVLGLLGSLMAALFALMAFGFLGTGIWFSGLMGQSQTSWTIDSAHYDIENHFSNNADTLPDEPTGDNIIAGYLDEWNNALKYVPAQGSTTDYTITSAGSDGQIGTADDIQQGYTAYSWTVHAAIDTPEDEVGEQEIAAAFDLAAKQIIDAFPTGASLPTEGQVTQQAGVLIDAWNMPLIYSPTNNPPIYHLKSAGPDGQWDTKDDLTRSFYFAPADESDGPL